MKKKTRTDSYYIALGEKLVAAGTVNREGLAAIISEVNVMFDMATIKNVHAITPLMKDIYAIYGDSLVVREGEKKSTRGKAPFMYTLKGFDKDKIRKYFGSRKADGEYTGVIGKKEIGYRDACLKKSKEIRNEHPEVSQEEAVTKAHKEVSKLTDGMINFLWKTIIPMAPNIKSNKLGSGSRTFLAKALDTLKYYGIETGIELKGKEVIFHKERTELINIIRDAAWNNLKLRLTLPPVNEEPHIVATTFDEKYAVLIMGGLIMKNGGRFVDIPTITATLRNNRYRKLCFNGRDIEGIVKKFPELLQRASVNGVSIVGDRTETWKKIQGECSPTLTDWKTMWCINSADVRLEDIQRVFPGSYQERPDVKVGSRIIVIKADRSIKAFIDLAILSRRFGVCDYPIGDDGLTARLEEERKHLDDNIYHILLGEQTTEEYSGNSDRLLFQIEENKLR